MQFITCTFDQHAAAILEILNEAILTTTAIYDYKSRSLENMVDWFKTKEAHHFPVIGAVTETGQLLGFASYGTFRAWPAYKYSVEHSIYVHKSHQGRGVGGALMRHLIATAKEQQYHVLIGGIDVTNSGSIALHEKLGFSHVGTIKQVAFKFDRWLDLAFYQLILETPVAPVEG